MATIAKWRQEVEQGLNPRDIKVRLAKEIVRRFHNNAAADKAHQEFVARFQKGQMPEDITEQTLPSDGTGLPVPQILTATGLTVSTSEAMRLIKQGGVRLDGERLSDPKQRVVPGETVVFQVGKRKFRRVTVKSK